MKQLYRHLVAVALMMLTVQGKSQDIHFSQIFETPILRNPSLAGLFNGDMRVQSVYRTQRGCIPLDTPVRSEYRHQ